MRTITATGCSTDASSSGRALTARTLSQTNKNLLLSDHAEIDTRPRLEIFTDDVKCTHGAAVGALDEEALFYLRSRGVPHEAARALLTHAFAREILDRIESEPLRTHVETLLAERLSADGFAIEGHTRDRSPRGQVAERQLVNAATMEATGVQVVAMMPTVLSTRR